MKIKIVQIDGKLPNLALMQLASWHRSRGDEVVYTRDTHHDLFEPTYDRVYGSAIFKFSADKIARLRATYPDAIIGGTGTDSTTTVEQVIGGKWDGRDYSIYPTYESQMGWPTEADIERNRVEQAERDIVKSEYAWQEQRITELEAALRDLLAMIDPIYDLEPVDRDAYYRAKTALERK